MAPPAVTPRRRRRERCRRACGRAACRTSRRRRRSRTACRRCRARRCSRGGTCVPRWRTMIVPDEHRLTAEALHAEPLRVRVTTVARGRGTLLLRHGGPSQPFEIPVISIVEYFWRWPQRLRWLLLFLYVKPLIFGPLASPTTRPVTDAPSSCDGRREHDVAVDQQHGPQRDLVAREPLDVERSPSVRPCTACRRSRSPHTCARAFVGSFGEPGDGSGTGCERPDLGLGDRSGRRSSLRLAAMALRVVVAEDNLLVREGVVRLLDHQDGIEVVGDLRHLRRAHGGGRRASRPTSSSPTSGCRRPGPTRASAPRSRCATRTRRSASSCSSQYVEPAYALALLERGSEGRAYLLKERVSDVEPARPRDRRGRARRHRDRPEGRRGARRERAAARPASPLERLTPREREVLAQMAQGRNNAGIAAGAGPVRTGGREAHQLAVLEARPRRGSPTSTAGSRPCCSSSSEQGG